MKNEQFVQSNSLVTSSSSSSSDMGSPASSKADLEVDHLKKFTRTNNSFAYRILDHVKLGPNITETVKGKLRLGAKIIQQGGRVNIFKQTFGLIEEEQLLKASQCYLSTTTGPIAGLLFISTHKIAFCSETSVSFPSPSGDFVKAPYKVCIPIKKIKSANKCENVDQPSQKYIHIVTNDGFDFWFIGFLRYDKAFTNLRLALSDA